MLDKKIRELKDSENKQVINIFMNHDIKGGWDLKVDEKAI